MSDISLFVEENKARNYFVHPTQGDNLGQSEEHKLHK
jgi:hypothetical protein